MAHAHSLTKNANSLPISTTSNRELLIEVDGNEVNVADYDTVTFVITVYPPNSRPVRRKLTFDARIFPSHTEPYNFD